MMFKAFLATPGTIREKSTRDYPTDGEASRDVQGVPGGGFVKRVIRTGVTRSFRRRLRATVREPKGASYRLQRPPRA